MITEFFLNVVLNFVFALTSAIRQLPDVALPAGMINAFNNAAGYISAVNAFFPVDTLLSIIAFVFILETSILTYKAVMWVVKRIPTQS